MITALCSNAELSYRNADDDIEDYDYDHDHDKANNSILIKNIDLREEGKVQVSLK